MRFMFDLIPLSSLIKPTYILILIAGIAVYLIIPVLMATLEYKLAKISTRRGLYLLGGTLGSAILLGLYSLFLTALLVLPFSIAMIVYAKKQPTRF